MSEETFEVILSPDAEKVYTRQDRKTRKRIAGVIDQLKFNPTSGPNISRLHGGFQGHYRIRLGGWRIIYSVEQRARKVFVEMIRSRGDVYKR